ncbi:FAD-dependent oxidoreductase [Salipiger sp. P9]|uniref:NAD(P)/FAD-dependent oxidoreductase n=1 Tax=Salipiger pentaromativorans TaxID=2943193 RepID=UPI0021582708|nr:FAD-dependent oxidoreductase [Salipiger pentaromativorans]MCR8546723.1 FAD-dependent oxidoreductase [Salipiger pentaromativorans]
MTKTVAVIGAGIVGVSTAIWLQRDGHKVILIDKAGPGEGTSHGNGGVLASCSVVPVPGPGLWLKAPKMLLDPNQPLFMKWSYLPKIAPWLMKFMSHANAAAVHKRAAASTQIIGDSYNDHVALASGTGAEKWLHPDDYVFLYNSRADYEADAFGFSVRKENGFEWELLEDQAFRDYDPIFSPEITCAARFPGHGRISDPGRYVKDLAAFAEAQGARLIMGEVTDIAREQGAVTGVRVGGETIACDAAVLTTGVWSGPLAEKLGVKPPLESERGYHLELYEPSVMPRAPVMIASGKFVATPMDGRLRLAGIVELGGLDLPPSRAPFALLERQIRAAIPGLSWKKTVEWMGHRPSMADSLPIIGESTVVRGAFMGFGHDHVGLTGGPKTGLLLSQLISGRTPNINLAPYAPDRFH